MCGKERKNEVLREKDGTRNERKRKGKEMKMKMLCEERVRK